MEQISEASNGKKNQDSIKNMEDVPKPPTIVNFVRSKCRDKEPGSEKTNQGYGDVNMEATISADDVLRAGGFGARDDIGSFLPVASDSTDFEAALINARDYEETQRDVSRPGLGFSPTK